MTRYAVYHLPRGQFGQRGAAWLGWDVLRGAPHPVPASRAAWVAKPGRYGFHATLKPPFHLAQGRDLGTLDATVASLARTLAPARADALALAALDGFLALRPEGASDLSRVASACVEALDGFRAPPSREELARRRAAGLTPAQEANLTRWGYPYVRDQFRYHLTLTARLGQPERALIAARAHFAPLPRPFALDALSLCVEEDGRFREIARHALTGSPRKPRPGLRRG